MSDNKLQGTPIICKDLRKIYEPSRSTFCRGLAVRYLEPKNRNAQPMGSQSRTSPSRFKWTNEDQSRGSLQWQGHC